MGKLGPLTSQALGRSPYDDVVQGDGLEDPRAPPQQYDERGRPVNPETKRINKDVIRSHNEVMLVIGVAEPDNGVSESQTEACRKHHQDEDYIGHTLLKVGRIVEAAGAWGVNGMRHRILLYKRYAHIPFYQLWGYERSQRSLRDYLFAGFPSFLVNNYLRLHPPAPFLDNNIYLRSASTWIRLHLGVFVIMQQTSIISASHWLPWPSFFVPFSETSPIPAPPPITSLTASEVARWVGTAALNAAPLAALYLSQRLWFTVRGSIWMKIRSSLPQPLNRHKRLSSRGQQSPQPSTSGPQTPPPATPNEQPRTSREPPRDEPTVRPLEGTLPNTSDPVAFDAIRRQSTFSTRGDEYASDDEETEVVSATLISFDVEATESSDTPPGIWSAELRPNIAEARSQTAQEPVYRENALTRLPAVLATDVLTALPARLLTAPSEAIVWRYFMRSYLERRGLGFTEIYGIGFLDSLTWTAAANLLGLELIHLFLEAEIWATMTTIAQLFRTPEEEWAKLQAGETNQTNETEEQVVIER